MGFLNKIFSNINEENNHPKMNWTALTNVSQLEDITHFSNEKPVLLFKHSTRCSISRMALKQFENEFGLSDKIAPYFLDLLEHRNISNEIAHRFGVLHQSPQVILIKDGIAVYDTSHEDIQAEKLKKFI